MIKIFIGNSTVFLSAHKNEKNVREAIRNKLAVESWEFTAKKKLAAKLEQIETEQSETTYIVLHDSLRELQKVFFSLYSHINAGGGAVFNEKDQLLMIYRKRKWDLPKGKADKGETIRHTALREIREETGIGQLKIIAPIKFLGGRQPCTYHTYWEKGRRVMKSTYWFLMTSNDQQKLIPQAEEKIERVEWCNSKKTEEHLKNSYHAIEEVVQEALEKKVVQ